MTTSTTATATDNVTKLRDQLIQDFARLSPEVQVHFANLVHSLAKSKPQRGATGEELLELAGIMDPESAREMREAIEDGCGQVDPEDW